MKKVLGILAILSLLMVPCVSMAATMSDADLAAVTGQSGVTIGISSSTIGLSFGSLTWGDYDGFTGYTAAGYVNILAYPVPMHVTLTNIALTIDLGTNAGVTAVQIGVASGTIKLDAFVADICLDGVNGAVQDYQAVNGGTAPYSYTFAQLAAVEAGTTGNTAKLLGVFGISRLEVTLPAINVTISAH